MKHRIPYSWSIRLPVSVRAHTPFHRQRKRFLACARNDTREKVAPSLSFTPPHRVMPLQSTLSCAFVRLSLPSYRHPERSPRSLLQSSSSPVLLIRLHEAPYPIFMEYQASRFRSHAHTAFHRQRKRFLAFARNDGTGKRCSRIASFPRGKGFGAGTRLSLLPMEGGAP